MTINTELETVDIPTFFWLGADGGVISLTKEEFNERYRIERLADDWRNGRVNSEEDEQVVGG